MVANAAWRSTASRRIASASATEIEAGGELRFVMQAQPNKDCGKDVSARPYSMTPD
jgi:putative alpha-1,2-mannosidase